MATQLLEDEQAVELVHEWHEEEYPECPVECLTSQTYTERNQHRLRVWCDVCPFNADLPIQAR